MFSSEKDYLIRAIKHIRDYRQGFYYNGMRIIMNKY